jgi:hypothetical protein
MPVRARSRAFQFQQVGVAVLVDAAQLVQLGIHTRGDDTTFAQEHGGFFGDGQERLRQLRIGHQCEVHAVQQGRTAGRLFAQGGQGGQRAAQARELTRAHLAKGHARSDAFHVADAAQGLAQRLKAVRQQLGNRFVALDGRATFARRVGQPQPQAATAHAGAAGVQQAQQRGAVFAAQGLHQFQVAVGGRWQIQQIAAALNLKAAHMGQCLALGVFGVAQQGAGCSMCHRQVLRVVALQTGHLQLFAQLAFAQGAVELPGRAWGAGSVGLQQGFWQRVAVEEDLGRRKPRQPRGQVAFATFGGTELAAGQAQPGQAPGDTMLVHGQQQRVGTFSH